jgi:hypothetical protein
LAHSAQLSRIPARSAPCTALSGVELKSPPAMTSASLCRACATRLAIESASWRRQWSSRDASRCVLITVSRPIGLAIVTRNAPRGSCDPPARSWGGVTGR